MKLAGIWILSVAPTKVAHPYCWAEGAEFPPEADSFTWSASLNGATLPVGNIPSKLNPDC